MKNLAAYVLAALLACGAAAARNSVMAGQGSVSYIQTRWFDIIFAEGSAASAARLAAQADAIYADICAAYGVEEQFRMPVVLSPATDRYNAYFFPFPYNHIVLLDTPPDEDLDVAADSVLGTFRHELTHAVTWNHTGGDWRRARRLLGDYVSLGSFTVPGLLSEGAAVAMESAAGEGRLNDAFFLHTARQAKLEGRFPTYADVAGSRDVYPADGYYSYGGPFCAWLQERYGMEAYAEWWHTCLTSDAYRVGGWRAHARTYAGYFKLVYGIPLREAWAAFEESVVVPDIPADPLESPGVADFFALAEGSTGGASRRNRLGARYEGLSQCRDGFAYIEGGTGSVWFVPLVPDGAPGSPRRLFSRSRLTRISLCADGRFLAAGYYGRNAMNYTAEVDVYDRETGGWFRCTGGGRAAPGLRGATVVRGADGAYYLAAVRTRSQSAWLEAYRLEQDGRGRLCGMELAASLPLPAGDMAGGLCGMSGGRLAAAYRSGLAWSVRVYAVGADGVALAADVPVPQEGMRLRELSCGWDADGREVLCFSWALHGTFPRLGLLRLDAAMYELMGGDVSGGVYCPVVAGKRAYYSGRFTEDRRLLARELAAVPLAQAPAVARPAAALAEEPEGGVAGGGQEGLSAQEEALLGRARAYRSPYYRRGALIPAALSPLSQATIVQYDRDLAQTGSIVFPGVGWVTANPWDGDMFFAGLAYDVFSSTGGAMLEFSGGSGERYMGTPLFSYIERPSVTFDGGGCKQAANYLYLAVRLGVGRVSLLTLYESSLAMLGRQQSAQDADGLGDWLDGGGSWRGLAGCTAAQDEARYLAAVNNAGVTFSSVHKVGAGYFERWGVAAGLAYQAAIRGELEDLAGADLYHALVPSVAVQLPRLLPFPASARLTCNLPLRVEAALTPSRTQLFRVDAEAVLLSVDVQRGWLAAPLFCNRVAVTAAYTGYRRHQNESWQLFSWQLFRPEDGGTFGAAFWRDAVELKVLLTGTVNTGAQTNVPLTVGAKAGYRLHRAAGTAAWYVAFANTMLF